MYGRWSGAVPTPVSVTRTVVFDADTSDAINGPGRRRVARGIASRLTNTWRSRPASAVDRDRHLGRDEGEPLLMLDDRWPRGLDGSLDDVAQVFGVDVQ